MIPGFFGLIRKNWGGIFGYWDFWLSLGIGVLIALYPTDVRLRAVFRLVLSTEIQVSVALLGLVLAALALVVAFMRDDILLVLHRTGTGLAEDVFPFSFTAALAVLTALIATLSIALVPLGDDLWLRITIGLSTTTFSWALFGSFSLVRVVFRYAELKAEAIDSGDLQHSEQERPSENR